MKKLLMLAMLAVGALLLAACYPPVTGAGLPATPSGNTIVFETNFANDTSIPSAIHEYEGIPAAAPTTQWNGSHVVLANGVLNLETYQDPAHAGPNGPWVSGGIAVWPSDTNNSGGTEYGETCVRSRVTQPTGVTQVELLWPNDGVWPPEVDFNESNGTNSSGGHLFYGSSGNPNVQVGPSGVDLTQWHDWCVDVETTGVTWTVDGTQWGSTTQAPNPGDYLHLTIQQEVWPCGNQYEQCPTSATPTAAPGTELQVAWIAMFTPSS